MVILGTCLYPPPPEVKSLDMTTIRSLIRDGDLPRIIPSDDKRTHQNEAKFKLALNHGSDNVFRTVLDLFYQSHPEAGSVRGIRMMHGLIGDVYSGALQTVCAVAIQQNVAILDMTSIKQRALDSLTIQQLVNYILNTPLRCVILVKIHSDEPRMQKVVKRIASREIPCHRRIIFCLACDDAALYTIHPGIDRISFPGTVEDKIAMLLYLVPPEFADPVGLRVVAEKLRDYTVFQPDIKRLINTTSTLDVYSSSLHYHVVRKNGMAPDDSLDDFPSFEGPWRRMLSEKLQRSLVPTPLMTSTCIHRVFPVGVCAMEALQCVQSAIPADLQTPYVMTVESQATEDRCGSIAIVQETRHTVVHINCRVDPGAMREVCRELRTGYRSVVQELTQTKSEIGAKLEKMNAKFDSDMAVLKALITSEAGERKRTRETEIIPNHPICNKKTCMKVVTDRFANGALKKQCKSCNSFHGTRRAHLMDLVPGHRSRTPFQDPALAL